MANNEVIKRAQRGEEEKLKQQELKRVITWLTSKTILWAARGFLSLFVARLEVFLIYASNGKRYMKDLT